MQTQAHSEETWISVVDKKKERRAKKGVYLSERTAYQLQKELDITGLARVLLSTESRNMQEDGWEFLRVLKIDETSEDPDPVDNDLVEYMCLPIPNKWNDRALFHRSLLE